MPENDTNTVCTGREQPRLTACGRIRRAAKRRRRAAFGVAQIVAIFLGLAILAVISGSQTNWFGTVRSGGDDAALKANIDRVAQAADSYWTTYAADRHGRRDIDLSEFCRFANDEFAVSDDLILRTLGVGDATGGALAANDSTQSVGAFTDGNAGFMVAYSTTASPVATKSAAKCTTAGDPDLIGISTTDSGYDLLVFNAASTAHTGAGAQAAPLNGTAAIELDDLQNVGLVSTNSVWMAQLHGWAAAEIPAGARTGTTAANDVLVFGGVSPSGRSFCLIKVFNASDRGEVGEYRVAHDASTTDATPIAVCSEGTTGTGENTARIGGGWPG